MDYQLQTQLICNIFEHYINQAKNVTDDKHIIEISQQELRTLRLLCETLRQLQEIGKITGQTVLTSENGYFQSPTTSYASIKKE